MNDPVVVVVSSDLDAHLDELDIVLEKNWLAKYLRARCPKHVREITAPETPYSSADDEVWSEEEEHTTEEDDNKER